MNSVKLNPIKVNNMYAKLKKIIEGKKSVSYLKTTISITAIEETEEYSLGVIKRVPLYLEEATKEFKVDDYSVSYAIDIDPDNIKADLIAQKENPVAIVKVKYGPDKVQTIKYIFEATYQEYFVNYVLKNITQEKLKKILENIPSSNGYIVYDIKIVSIELDLKEVKVDES